MRYPCFYMIVYNKVERICGDNAIDVIYDLQQGKIYSEYPVISFDMSSVRAVDDNGEHTFESYEELKEWWEDV